MANFSKKFNYSNNKPIVEDAPIWLRKAFIQDVLQSFMWEWLISPEEPISLINKNRLIDRISIGLKRDLEYYFQLEPIYDEDLGKVLTEFFREIDWFEFYDIIEIIGKEIESSCIEWLVIMSSPEYSNYASEEPKYYSRYIESVNNFFEKNNVKWRLDSNCSFHLLLPSELLIARNKVSEKLIDSGLGSTSQHFNKSESYFSRLPTDPPNSIKEMVSAIEALGTKIYPNIKKLTLTKMVKEMQKENTFPDYFLSIVQTFYNFACSEPGVRHGVEESIKVRVEDAEFCFHLGTSILYYIIAVKI